MQNHWVEFTAKDSVVLRSGDADLALKPGQVLVRGEVSVISPGTELAVLHARFLPRPHLQGKPPRYPITPGYAMVGEVVETADDRVKVGERLLVGKRHSLYNVLDVHRMTQWCRVPEGMASPDAALGSLAQIALTAPLSIDVRFGHRVLVIGLGIIGYLAAQWFRNTSALEVCGCDLREDRTAFAAARGVGVVTASEAERAGPYDIVVEATGAIEAVRDAFGFVREGGAVLLLGTSREKLNDFDIANAIHRKLVTVVGAHVNRHDRTVVVGPPVPTQNTRELAVRYIHAGKICVEGLVGRVFPAEQAPQAYAVIEPEKLYTVGLDWTRLGSW